MSKQDIADYVFKTPHNTNPAILNQKLDELVEESGGSVQPDWNQNDETAADYVKNRPGGYDTVIPAKEITWDGNPEGRETISIGNDAMVCVSSDVLSAEQFEGAELTISENGYERTEELHADSVTQITPGIYAIWGDAAVVVTKPGATLNALIFPSAGVYFTKYEDAKEAELRFISRLVIKESTKTAKIPNKYLDAPSPDDVAEAKATAEAAKTTAEAAQTTAEAAQTTAEAALPIAGGTMAGDIIMKSGFGIRADEVTPLKMSINSEVSKPDFYVEKYGTKSRNEMYLKAGFTNDDSAASYVSLLFTRNFNTTTLTLPTDSSTSTIPAVLKLVGTNKKAVTLDQVGMIVFREPDDNAKYYHLKSDENDSLVAENFNGIIINSSTPGSTKKFKITVNDSGTLTATEVT